MKILFEFATSVDLSVFLNNQNPEKFGIDTSLFDKYRDLKFDKCIEIFLGRNVKLRPVVLEEDKITLEKYLQCLPNGNLSINELMENEIPQLKQENIEIVEYDDLLDYEHLNAFVKNIIAKEPTDSEKYIFFSGGNLLPFSFYEMIPNLIREHGFIPHPIMADQMIEAIQSDPDFFEKIKNIGSKIHESQTGEKVDSSFDDIFTACNEFIKVKELALEVAKNNIEILLIGESGTGKELFAKAIHKHSGRKGEFVAINCAAFSDNLLESEIFGHEKGAFTGAIKLHKGIFERGNKGTVFLDEVAEMSLLLQAKLLRTIESKIITRVGGENTLKFDAKIICATNKDLLKEVRNLKFREDLYFRLKKIELNIPPLRERGQLDIAYIFTKICNERKYPVTGITESASKLLLEYDFPGNVRELISIVESAIAFSQSAKKIIDDEIIKKSIGIKLYQEFEKRKYGAEQNLSETHKQDDHTYIMKQFLGKVNIFDGFKLKDFLSEVERHYIKESLKMFKTQEKASVALGYTQQTISNKIKKYNIDNRQIL